MAAIGPIPAVLRTGKSVDTVTLAAQLAAIACAGITAAVCDVHGLVPDAAAIDGLARLRLHARRLGFDLRLHHVPGELRQLLGFVGLADVLLGFEVPRETEDRKQPVGVEEERELGDPGA
jgi:hypothetical protein